MTRKIIESLEYEVNEIRKQLKDAEATLRAERDRERVALETRAFNSLSPYAEHPGFQALALRIMRDRQHYTRPDDRPGLSDLYSARYVLYQMSEALSCLPSDILELWKGKK